MMLRALISAAIAGALCLALPTAAWAHDPDITQVRLDNGLAFYVWECQQAGNTANAYLLCNIGSAVEAPDEQGMAHFIEHLAVGGRYGKNFTANTGQDFTSYAITQINANDKEAVASALATLKQIACQTEIADEAVERERKIILEEWRQSGGASHRVTDFMCGLLYGEDSPYSHLPIGDPGGIAEFTAEGLREFYGRWYQPQHQAIVVVGAVNGRDVAKMIKKAWRDVPAPEQPSQRAWTQIADVDGPKARVFTDPELRGCQADLWCQAESAPHCERACAEYANRQLAAAVAARIADQRLQDVMYADNSPWSNAHAQWGQWYWADSRQGLRLYANYDRKRRDEALGRLLSEAKSLSVNGVSAAELALETDRLRARAQKMPQQYVEASLAERARLLAAAFNTGVPLMTGEERQAMCQHFCDTVTVAAINALLRRYLQPERMAISLAEKSAEGVAHPSDGELGELAERLWAEAALRAPDDLDYLSRPLLATLPEPGEITAMEEESEFEARIYALGNGARAVAAFRDNDTDRICVRAVRRGGKRALAHRQFAEGYFAPTIADVCGMGQWSPNDLRRKLSDTRVSVKTRATAHAEIVDGVCGAGELETLMQLMHLRMTAVRDDTAAVENWRRAQMGHLRDIANDPDVVFDDSLMVMLYGRDNRLMRYPTPEDVDTLDHRAALELMRESFADAGQWEFVIVGDIDFEATEQLMARYLASLPGEGSSERGALAAAGRRVREGAEERTFGMAMEKPFSRVAHVYELHQPYSLADEMAVEALGNMLREVFIAVLREQSGATYSPSVTCASSEADGFHRVEIRIDTNAEMAPMVSEAIAEAIEQLAIEGVDPELYDRVMEVIQKEEDNARHYQDYPLRFYTHQWVYGNRNVAERATALRRVTPADIQRMAAALLGAQGRYRLTMVGLHGNGVGNGAKAVGAVLAGTAGPHDEPDDADAGEIEE